MTSSAPYEYYYYDDDVIPMTPEVQIPSAIGLSLLIIIAIGGNSITFVAYIRDKKLNTVYDFFIFNLGITDLLLSLISMPFYVVYTLTEFTWPFGYGFCKVWLVVDFTVCFQSILMMLILSLDRLLMLVWGPLYIQKVTVKVALLEVIAAWIISFLVYGPAIIGWNYWVGYSTVEEEDCDVEFAYDHTFTTVTSIVEFILPFVCLTTLNAVIYLKIRQRTKIKPSTARPNQTAINLTAQSGRNASNVSTEGIKINQKPQKAKNDVRSSNSDKQLKAARFLAILVVAFLVFWGPYIVTTMAISFCDDCINISLYEFFNWLLWMKSAVNPFLYAYNSPRYRAHFIRYLTCNGRLKICKKQNADQPTASENRTQDTVA